MDCKIEKTQCGNLNPRIRRPEMRFRPVFMRLSRNNGFHLMGEKLIFEIAGFMGQFRPFCHLIRGFGVVT